MDDNSGASQAQAEVRSALQGVEYQLGTLEHNINFSPQGQPVSQAVTEFVTEQRSKLTQIAASLNDGSLDAAAASEQVRLIGDSTNQLTGAAYHFSNQINEAQMYGRLDEAMLAKQRLDHAAQTATDDLRWQMSNLSGGAAVSDPVSQANLGGQETDASKAAKERGLFDPIDTKNPPKGLSLSQAQSYGRIPNEQSTEAAAERLADPGLDPHINAIIDHHAPNASTPLEKVKAIQTDAALRKDLGGYFIDKINANVSSLPQRVQENGSKSPKTGGYVEDLTSREYSAQLALSKIDGSFKGDGSDVIEKSPTGEVIKGQHRAAADLLLGSDLKSPPAYVSPQDVAAVGSGPEPLGASPQTSATADKPLPKVQLAGPRQTVAPDTAPEGFGISADGTRFQSGPVSDNSIAAIADRGEPLPQLPKVEPAGPRVVFNEQDFPAASQTPGQGVSSASDSNDFFGGSPETPAAPQDPGRLTLSQEDLQPPRTTINEADLKPKIQITEADLGAAPAAGSVITPGAGSTVDPGEDLNDTTVKKVQVIRSDGTVDGGWLETGRTGDVVTVTKVQNGEVLTKNVRLSDFELAQQYPAGAVIDRAAISSSNVQPVGRNDFGSQYEPNGERNARPTMIDRETGMTWSVPRDGVSTTSVSTSPSSAPPSPADPLKDKPADAPAASSAAAAEPADPTVAEPVTSAAAADSGADPKVGWKSYEYNPPPGNQTAEEWAQWKKEADAKPKVEINTAAVVSDESHPFGETGWQWTDKPKPIQQLKNADAAVENIGTELSTKVNSYVAKKYGNTKAFKVAQKVGYFRDPGSGSATDNGENSLSASEQPKADHSTGASTKDGRVKITVSGEEPAPSAAKLAIDKAKTAAPDKPAASEPKPDHTSPLGGSAAPGTEPGGSHTAHDEGNGNKLKEGKRTVINDGSPGVDQGNHVNLRTKENIGQPKPRHGGLIDDNHPGVDQPHHVSLTGNDKPGAHKVSLVADAGSGGEDVKGVGAAAEAVGSGSKILKGAAAVSRGLGIVGDTVMAGTLVYEGGKDAYKHGKALTKDIQGGHPINAAKDAVKLADVPAEVGVNFVKQNVSMAHQAVTTETAGVSKKVSLAGQMVTVGDNHTPEDTLKALQAGMGPGWKMVNKHTHGLDDYVFERRLYNSKGQPSGSQVVTDGTFEMTTKGAGSPYKDPATQKRIAADEKLNHKLFTPTTPGGTAPINDPNSYLKPKGHTQPVKPDVKGLSGSQTLPEEMSTAQLSGWGWHLAKKGTSTTPAVWTKNGNTLDIYENGSATYTNTANGHAITQTVRVADARNAGFTGGSGSAAGAVPAGAVADPNHAGRYLVTTKKAGGSYNGATETNVYDKNGHLLGQNVTYYSNGKRYDYGYDFGSRPPAGAGYSSSGELIIPGVNDKTMQTSTVSVPVSRDPGARPINLAGGGWMKSKSADSFGTSYWYREIGTKNGKPIFETFYPDPKSGEGVIMNDGKRSGYGQTGNLDMIGGSSMRTVTTTTNVKVASGLHFTDVNHPASPKAASAVHALASAPAPVPIPAQSSPSYVPEPTRPKAPSLQISAAKPSGWESHSTGDLAGRIAGQTITVNGKRYEDVTVSHFTDGTSTYQVKGKIIGYGEPAGAGGARTETTTPNNTPAPKTNPKTHNHSVAASSSATGTNNSGYTGNASAKNTATTMISDHPTINNTPAQVNLVSENGGGMGASLRNGTGEGSHAYSGGAAIESVKHLKNGATLTTTATGAQIETTTAGNSYVVKAAPAPASDAATAYRHGIEGGLPGAASEVHMAPTTPQAVAAEAASSNRITEPQQPAAAPAPSPEPARSMPHGAILAESEAEGSVNPNLTPSNAGAIAAGRPAVTQSAPSPEPARGMPHGAVLAESEAEGAVNPNLTPSNGGAIAAGMPAAAPAPAPTVTQSQIEAATNYAGIANTKSNDMMAPVTSGPAFTLPVSSHPTDVTATNALSNFNVTSNVRRFGRQIE